ncbi:Uncharacterised protein [Mycobacteroides abscessus subsp. abscessus]|nr:Uncharacterised protein [Mycobacteroides abscessus subsp. abscessus]
MERHRYPGRRRRGPRAHRSWRGTQPIARALGLGCAGSRRYRLRRWLPAADHAGLADVVDRALRGRHRRLAHGDRGDRGSAHRRPPFGNVLGGSVCRCGHRHRLHSRAEPWASHTRRSLPVRRATGLCGRLCRRRSAIGPHARMAGDRLGGGAGSAGESACHGVGVTARTGPSERPRTDRHGLFGRDLAVRWLCGLVPGYGSHRGGAREPASAGAAAVDSDLGGAAAR